MTASASLTKDDELSSFDVPEIDRHSSSNTLYKIVLQVTPKELTENSYQVNSLFFNESISIHFHLACILETI